MFGDIKLRPSAVVLLAMLTAACGNTYQPNTTDAGFQPFDLGGGVDTSAPPADTAVTTDTAEDTTESDAATDATSGDASDVTADTADAGCQPTTPPDEVCDNVDNDCDGETDNNTCDDNNPCTSQKCDGDKGAAGEDGCIYGYADGTPCDDGSPCTTGDSCASGACIAGQKTDCDDNNTCTVDACKSDTGQCENLYLGDGKFCNDGQACTLNDVCTDGKCKGKASGKCDDGNPCTEDGCNDDGSCSNKTVDNLPCDDSNPCTKGDKCFIGVCVGNEPTVCDDQKPCTDDFCDPKQGGCVYKAKLLGSPCSDGLCTIGGSCDQNGACTNQKAVCDDKTPCTVDSCEPANGKCTHTPLATGTPCDDGEACTTGEACDAQNQCTPPAGQKGCDDGNPCTDDVCNIANKTCSNKLKNGPCDDGDACTQGEACVTGKCVTGPSPNTGTAAGTGNAGFADGNAKTASLNLPRGLDYAGDGTVYIADRNNHRVRALTPQGQVSTFAGEGTKGMVDGPGSSARFSSPEDVAVSATGVIYVADAGNQRIRAVSTKTAVTTFAGNGTAGAKDGPAATASFNTPSGLAVAPSGEVLVADTYNHRIRMIDSAKQQVSTLAGSGLVGFADGAATSAKFNFPYGVDVAKDGTIYVADTNNHRIRKVTMKGQVTTVAGTGTKGSVNNTALAAQLNGPVDVVALIGGGVAIAERDGHAIRMLRPDGLVVTVAGSGAAGFAEGVGAKAQLNQPWGVTSTPSGALLVGDSLNHRVRRLTSGNKVCNDGNACTADSCNKQIGACQHDTLKAGDACEDGSACTTGDTCDAFGQCKGQAKSCDDKSDCTTDSCNAFTGQCEYIPLTKACNDNDACTTNDVCVDGKCSSGAGAVSNFSGSGQKGFLNGAAASARFQTPSGVAVDSAGNVYVGDRNNHRIRKLTPTGTASTFAGTGSAGFIDGAPTVARFYYPEGLAFDDAGTLWVADSQNHRVRTINSKGQVSTAAGSSSGFADGVKTVARFAYPRSAAPSPTGDVYIADQGNNRIRKLSKSGVVSTLAGSGQSGFADGPANSAKFNYPYAVVFGPKGNVYVADSSNHRVRRIGPDGTVTTLAGNGSAGSNDGIGQGASLNAPRGLAVDGLGNLIVSTFSGHRIRRITLSGAVFTLAGSAGKGYADGAGSVAKFDAPLGVATNATGDVFIADQANNRIRKMASTQVVCADNNPCTADSCDATTGKCAFKPIAAGDACEDGDGCTVGETCTAAGKCEGGKPKTCNDGNLCTLDQCNSFSGDCVFPPSPGLCDDGQFCTINDRCDNGQCVGDSRDIYTVAGSGANGSLNGPGLKASFATPESAVLKDDGTIYVVDYSGHKIRRISKFGEVSTFAGSGGSSYAEGQGLGAAFYYPTDIELGATGDLVVTDSYNNRVRTISPAGKTALVAGQSSNGYVNGTGSSARFYRPMGLTVNRATGDIIVADTYNHRIRLINKNKAVTLLAGAGGTGNTDGAPNTAKFYYPRDVAVDKSGTVFVSDYQNHRIRRIDAKTKTVTSIAGSNLGFADGKGTSAKFNYPYHMVFDNDGDLLVADMNNHRIRRVTTSGQASVFLGSGASGYKDDGALLAQFKAPRGVAVNSKGDVVVVDTGNYRIRKTNSPFNSCEDGNECTLNACDEKTKKCVASKAPDFTTCTDGNPCLLGGLCNLGKCVGGVDKNVSNACNDNDKCTTDSCNKLTGECQYALVPGCVPPVPPLTKIVISGLNNATKGNLGGIAGADAKCMQEAKAAGKAGKWRAFLSSSQQNVKDLIKGKNVTLAVYNIKGQLIFNNWNDIFDGNSNAKTALYSFIGRKYDEGQGASPDWQDADGWTGSLTNGTVANNYTCNDWTSTSGSGRNTELDLSFTLLGQETQSCSSNFAMLCVTVGE